MHLPDENPNHYYISGYEEQSAVGDITAHTDARGGRRVLDQFDWVSFLDHKLKAKE